MIVKSFKTISFGEVRKTKDMSFTKNIYNINGNNGSGKSKYLKEVERSIFENEQGKLLVYNSKLSFPIHLSEKKIISLLTKYNPTYNFQDYQVMYKDKALYNYSDGERKLVLIKILVYLKPDYLIIDEPFSEISSENSKYILELLKGLKETTIIISSHDKLCDDMIIDINIESLYEN